MHVRHMQGLPSKDAAHQMGKCLNRYLLLTGKIEISRSFGDLPYKSCGMSAQPDIKIFDITSRDQFLLLGCDGFWSVFGPDDAVAFARDLIQEGATAKHVCNRLINEVRHLL